MQLHPVCCPCEDCQGQRGEYYPQNDGGLRQRLMRMRAFDAEAPAGRSGRMVTVRNPATMEHGVAESALVLKKEG